MEKRKGRLDKQIAAWLLAFIMAAGLMAVPAKSVEAAETVTVTGAEDTTKPIHVKVTVSKTIPAGTWADNSPAEELNEYAVEIVNGSAETISDWELTIACNTLSTYNAGWNGAPSSVAGGNKIVIGTYKGTGDDGVWTNATIDAGKSANGAGFQMAARELANATYTLTYKMGESSGIPSVDDTATDPSVIGTSSDKVKATFTQKSVDGVYHEYYIKIDNQTSDSIGDWIVAVPIKGITKVEDWSSWAKVKTCYTSDYLYISPVGSAVISAGSSFGSTTVDEFKFNYYADSALSGAVVYYKTGTSSSNAFDSVINNATGGSSVGGGGGTGGSGGVQIDTTTDLGLDIEYNYAKLLQESLYFYDANMCGPEVASKCGLNWRGDCHTADQKANYGGQIVDVSGGFHDAGDHVKFGLAQGYSAATLALGYYEFKDAYNELGQTAHYQLIMDHFCDYFVNCTVYSDNAKKTGTVQAFCYQVGDGTDGDPSSDHGYWGPPEKQGDNKRSSTILFTGGSQYATDVVSISACALALHAYNFPDSEKSAQYLQTAKDLFAYAKKNSKTCYVVAQYRSDSWEDDYCSAAAALYLATGESQYLTELNQYYGSINAGWVLCWNKTWGIAAALKKDWSAVNSIAACQGNVGNSKQGFLIVDGWGSARYNTTNQFLGLLYDKENNKFNSSGSFTNWATGQMKYLLGNNQNKRCFVVGYNENSSKYPHHRAASNSSDAGSVNAEGHYVLLGALVGGPSDANDTYADNQADYNCNEVALDYNAGFVGAAAGLYLLHRDDVEAVNTLASESELSAIGVTKYYGESSALKVPVESVSLEKTSLVLDVEQTGKLTATVTPSNATNKKVTWTSSDSNVAAVSGGTVTAVAPGTATITVTTADGEKTASCTVKVNKKKITAVTFPTVSGKVAAGTALKDVELSKTSDAYGTFAWAEPDEKVTVDMTGADVVYTLTEAAQKNAELADTLAGVSDDKTQVTRKVAFTVDKQIPVVTVSESMDVEAGTELSAVSSDEWTASTEGTFSWKEADKVLTIKDNDNEFTLVFTPDDENNYESVEKKVVLKVKRKKRDKTPGAVQFISKTATSITASAPHKEEAVQYGIALADGLDKLAGEYIWSEVTDEESYVFNDLEPYTEYMFAVRYPETDIYEAGEPDVQYTVTYFKEEDCYKVDLTKLNSDERSKYVEGHNDTIAYDISTKTLTLLKAGSYTITGNAPDIIISCETADTLILNKAECQWIDTKKDVAIKLIGDNTVKEGIHGGENKVTIQNGNNTGTSGSLTVSGNDTGAIAAGTIILESGKVTATGSGEAAALKASTKIQLLGGVLTANAAEGVIPIQAEEIVIEGCQIQSDAAKIYSTDPVDTEGNLVTFCKVTYQNKEGEQLVQTEVKKGGTITLVNPDKVDGYKALGWKKDGSGDVIKAGTEITVSEDIAYVAEYIEIEGTLEVLIHDAEPLIVGYLSDPGVLVEVTNKTNVTIDELAFALDNGEQFTLSAGEAGNLAPLNEEGSNADDASVSVYVRLKKGLGVNTDGYRTALTISCEEAGTVEETITRIVEKAAAEKPEKPQLKSKTSDSVILQTVEGAQYGIKQADGITWQETNRFTELLPYTEYTFVIRMKETADKKASPASDGLTVTTYMTEEEQFKVNVSKVTDSGYMEAHNGTVSVEGNVLVLEKPGTYTITGHNEDMVIRAKKDVTIILDNAVIKAIETAEDCTKLDIRLTGESKIVSEDTAAIKGGMGCTVTISKQDADNPGSVVIAGGGGNAGIAAGNVTIQDGTVTITGNGNGAGVSASGKVEIAGGEVAITGGGNGAAIEAGTVNIEGGRVSVTGQGDKPAIIADNKNIKIEIQQKNGSSYKEPEKGDDKKEDDKKEDDDSVIKATGMKVTAKVKGAGTLPVQKIYKLAPRKSMTLQVIFLPASAEKEALTYTSSNPKLVKVDKNGKITAGKKAGTATITIKSKNGLKKTVKVKVMKKPVKKVTIKASQKTIKVKKTLKLKAVTTPGKASAGNTVVWKSNKTKIATVSAKGVVKAKKRGTVKITAYATDGSGKKATITLKVK